MLFIEEDGIGTIFTNLPKFTRCSNSKCKTIYLIDNPEILGDFQFLCQACRKKLESFHMVQCQNCQAIVNFIRSEPGEEPIVFHVDKCLLCTGTKEDEKRLHPYFYPEAFM